MLACCWGAAFLFVDVIVEEVDPLTIVAGRLVIASAVLVPAALLAGAVAPPRAAWGAVALMAVFNNVIPFTLITVAQDSIASSLAATLVGTMPLFVLIITSVTGTEQPSRGNVAGLIVGFAGAVIVIGPDLADVTSSNTIAQLAVLASSLSYAVSTVIARQWAKGPPLSLAASQLIIAAAITIPLALVVDGTNVGNVSGKALASWLALGVVSSGVAYLIFYTLVQRISATQVSLVTYLIPIVATVLGWAVLDEHIGVNLFVGLALIIVGVMAVNGSLSAVTGYVRGRGSAREGDPASLT